MSWFKRESGEYESGPAGAAPEAAGATGDAPAFGAVETGGAFGSAAAVGAVAPAAFVAKKPALLCAGAPPYSP